MSVAITCAIICDNCGVEVYGDIQRATAQGATAYWSAKARVRKAKWLILTRYGKARHLCQPCADGQPIKAVASPPNPNDAGQL